MTIGELSAELGVPQHILRYWETRFPKLRPLTRAGNRRYYRPEDVALVRRIHRLLNAEGYTVKGAQKLLASKAADDAPLQAEPPRPIPATQPALPASPANTLLPDLVLIRDRLKAALAA